MRQTALVFPRARPRNLFDRLDNVSFDLRLRLTFGAIAQRAGCHQGTRPGAKILGAKFCAGDLAQIFIDIARFNGNRRAGFVDILKQLVAWQILATFDDPRQALILQIDRMFDAALTAKLKANVPSVYFYGSSGAGSVGSGTSVPPSKSTTIDPNEGNPKDRGANKSGSSQ